MQSEEEHPPAKKAKVTNDGVCTNEKDTVQVLPFASSSPLSPEPSPSPSSPNELKPIRPVKVRHTGQWKIGEDGALLYRTCKRGPKGVHPDVDGDGDGKLKVAGLDMGGTLLDSLIQFPSALSDYELWNTSVISKLRDLSDNGHYCLIIFINQGGIRGAINGKTATKIKDLIEWLANSVIERPLYAFVSTKTKSGFHKPSGKMWKVAERILTKNRSFDTSNSFFVGDGVNWTENDQLIEGDDEKFASGIGVKFFTPKDFFGLSSKERRLELKVAANRLAYKVPPKKVLVTRAALHSGYLKGPILLILSGPQGSGKSFFCHQLVTGAYTPGHWVHFSQDTIRGGKPGTREAVEHAAEQALRCGKSVVVDRMHLDEIQRSFFVRVSKDVGVPVHCVVLTTPKSVVADRVLKRTDHPGSVQGEAGSKMAERSWASLVMPTYEEGFSLINAAGTVMGVNAIINLYRNVTSALDGSMVQSTTSAISIPDSFAVPKIAFGTYLLGKKVARDAVATAVNLGIAGVDTAPTYNNEEQVGKGLDKDTFLIIKVPKRATTGKMVKEELKKSLQNLGREKADLLLLHWPCDVISANTLQEVWLAMEQCVKNGYAGALGVCNFNVAALCLLLPNCVDIRPSVLQIERHVLLPQWELVEFCAQHDISIQAHTPLGQGDLTQNSTVKNIAALSGISPAQVLLQWNIIQNVAIVTKSTSVDHVKEVVESGTRVLLSEHDMKVLDEIDEMKRFVYPPFMLGNESYCWGRKGK